MALEGQYQGPPGFVPMDHPPLEARYDPTMRAEEYRAPQERLDRMTAWEQGYTQAGLGGQYLGGPYAGGYSTIAQETYNPEMERYLYNDVPYLPTNGFYPGEGNPYELTYAPGKEAAYAWTQRDPAAQAIPEYAGLDASLRSAFATSLQDYQTRTGPLEVAPEYRGLAVMPGARGAFVQPGQRDDATGTFTPQPGPPAVGVNPSRAIAFSMGEFAETFGEPPDSNRGLAYVAQGLTQTLAHEVAHAGGLAEDAAQEARYNQIMDTVGQQMFNEIYTSLLDMREQGYLEPYAQEIRAGVRHGLHWEGAPKAGGPAAPAGVAQEVGLGDGREPGLPETFTKEPPYTLQQEPYVEPARPYATPGPYREPGWVTPPQLDLEQYYGKPTDLLPPNPYNTGPESDYGVGAYQGDPAISNDDFGLYSDTYNWRNDPNHPAWGVGNYDEVNRRENERRGKKERV